MNIEQKLKDLADKIYAESVEYRNSSLKHLIHRAALDGARIAIESKLDDSLWPIRYRAEHDKARGTK